MEDPKLFSAYMLDPEHGWNAVHRLPLDAAIRYCKEYRSSWAGSRVALVPDGMNSDPFLEFASAIA